MVPIIVSAIYSSYDFITLDTFVIDQLGSRVVRAFAQWVGGPVSIPESSQRFQNW